MTYSPYVAHHDGSALYVHRGSYGGAGDVELGDTVRLRIQVPGSDRHRCQVTLRTVRDQEPQWFTAHPVTDGPVSTQPGAVAGTGTPAGTWWEASLPITAHTTRYRWVILWPDTGEVHWVSQRGVSVREPVDSHDFFILTGEGSPEWMHQSVMYQIFPDRFARSGTSHARQLPDWAEPAQWDDPVNPVMPHRVQQFYGGDLDGITERLDYLEDLGVDLIYLTPIFPGASNHRYDASTFDAVDPLLGGDEAYIRLIEAAHARGMKVIGDLTTNHSGDGHSWFRTAVQDPESEERDYYLFHESAELPAPTPGYECWLGAPSLPKFNWHSRALRRRFIEGEDSVVGRWLKPPFNADGWRIDVANMTGRLGTTDLNAEVRQTMAATMAQINPDALLLAESTNDASVDLTGDAWHGAMTYPSFTRPLWSWLSAPTGEPFVTASGELERTPWFFGQPVGGIPPQTAADFAEAMHEFTASVPWRIRVGTMHTLDTHDTARFATHAAPGTMPLAVALQMTLPGLPSVFAGDEMDAVGGDGEISRTPMPWSRWESQPPAQTWQHYRELIHLKRSSPALRAGGLRWLYADEHMVVFLRESREETLLVCAARSETGHRVTVSVPESLIPGDVSGSEVRPTWSVGDVQLAAPSLTASSGAVESYVLEVGGTASGIWRFTGSISPQW